MVGTAVAQLVALCGTIVLARVIGKASFGQFGTIQSTTLMLANVAGAGFGLTATRYTSLYRSADPDRAGRVLGMLTLTVSVTGLLFGAILATFSSVIAAKAFDFPDLSYALVLGAPYVVFLTLNGFQLGALSGLEAFKQSAIVAVIQAITNTGCILLLALHWGLRGAIAGLSIAGCLSFLLYHAGLSRRCRESNILIRYRHSFQERAAFFSFGLPAGLSGILGNIAIWSCYAITAHSPNGFKEIAAVSAANSLRMMILFVPGIVAKVALPINCHQHGQGQDIRSTIKSQFLLTVGLAMLVAITLLVLGPILLRLFGKEFAGDMKVLALFCCVAVLEVASANLANVFVILNKLWYQAGIIGVWSLVLVGGCFCSSFICRPGIALGMGYASAWLVALCLYAGLSYGLLRTSECNDPVTA